MRTLLRKRKVLGTIIPIVVLIVLLLVTVKPFPVIGDSMEPTLHWGQWLLTNKIAYHSHEPERGDIIIFHPLYNPKVDIIKRLIALPDDTVEVRDGVVYVNDLSLDEPYVKEPPTYIFFRMIVPENEYFVLGDNRNDAFDSHVGWTLPRQSIVGKAWLSIWPPSQWGLVAHYSLQEQLVSPAQ